jgi:[ribosomal protein S18]-alanine N-acetyltransferase
MIAVVEGNGTDVSAIMPVMDVAFDPRFGEAWTAAQCLSILAMPGSRLLIARQETQTVGFALSRWVIDEEELLLIGVDPNCRRAGVGRNLINALLNNAKLSAHASIFLEVRNGNPAQNFYHEMGFRPIGRRPGYYKGNDGSRHDSITMQMNML